MLVNKSRSLSSLFLISFAFVAHADVCEETGHTDTPSAQFLIDVELGTVIDRKTNLMWKRCIEGMQGAQCLYEEGSSAQTIGTNWEQSATAANAHEFAGLTDWRIPNIIELMSIYDFQCYNANGTKKNHGINFTIFPSDDLADLGLYLWSSTYSADRDRNFAISYFYTDANKFDAGPQTYYRSMPAGVRLVRNVFPMEFEPELTQGSK